MKLKAVLYACLIFVLVLFCSCAADNEASVSVSSTAPISSVEPQVTLTLLGEKEITLEAGTAYTDLGATADEGYEVEVSGAVDTGKSGKYVLTYSAGDATVKRTVTVVDTKAPAIKLNGNAQTYASSEALYKEQGAAVSDNSSAKSKLDIKRSAVKDGAFTVTYTATDAAGNKSTVHRKVIVKDIVKPTVKLVGSADMYVERDSSYTEAGFSATDDLDGDITSLVEVSGSVDITKSGAYTITYTVSDKAGNKTVVKRVVHIYSQQSDCPDRVYLTFDDGPTSTITPKVLDALKRNNVKATFFIINYPESRKALVQRVVNEGHTLAIHAYSHDYKTCYSSADAYMQGLEKMRAKILADTGYDARIIRFPGGTSNSVSKSYCKGVMTELCRRTVEEGYSSFDWNVSSQDATGQKVTSSQIYNNVVNGLRRNRNNVVLMHDAAYKNATVASLDDIINYCKKNGYAVLPITADTVPVRHKPNN